jgi:hypothetical protein
MQHYTKHQNQVDKLQGERQIFNHEKEIFYNLNLMFNGGKLYSMFNAADEKINEMNNKISMNNITLPTAAVSYSTGSLYINNLKSISQKGSIELRMSDIPNSSHSKQSK